MSPCRLYHLTGRAQDGSSQSLSCQRLTYPHSYSSSETVPFYWTPEAEVAFSELKRQLISSSILVHPDQSLQFIVEVDASNTGVGTILSQHSLKDNKLQLDPPERDYDVGKQELLALVMA